MRQMRQIRKLGCSTIKTKNISPRASAIIILDDTKCSLSSYVPPVDVARTFRQARGFEVFHVSVVSVDLSFSNSGLQYVTRLTGTERLSAERDKALGRFIISRPSNIMATSHAALDPLTSMLHNSTIDKAERNEFTNTARDMFKFVLNYYQNGRSPVRTGAGQVVEEPVHEFHDAINYLLNTVPHFLDEVRKNDQSRSTVGETPGTDRNDPVSQVTSTNYSPHSSILDDPVDIIDIVPPEPFSLPVANIADRYTRSMLKCLVGYPLYNPKPYSELSKEYPKNGVNVGDVGFVRDSGTFDFLFNICPSKNGLINPPNLPEGFTLETLDHAVIEDMEPLPRNTCLFQNPVTKTKSCEYICEGSEGAILELPEGAIQDEVTNTRPFANLAARHGVQWYEYTMSRGRGISNGSLYLITSVTKCTQWGIAVFDRPCTPGQGLKFDKKRTFPFNKLTSKYHWKGSGAFPFKVSKLNQGEAPNQCVFLRGYKIMVRQDIFDNLCKDQLPSSSQVRGITMTRQPATRIRGGGGSDFLSKGLSIASLSSRIATTKSDEEVMLHPNFNSSLVHPSDLINAALLSQNPEAKVALTHDDVWCDLLRDNFPKVNYATLVNIARSYTNNINEYDCVSLQRISNSSNILVLNETTCQIQGSEITTIQQEHPRISSTLPHELVERILLLLDTKSMLTCRLVNSKFNMIVQSSTLLQYFLACKAAGVIDNSQSPLSYAERLEALRKRENAWRKLKPMFEITIKVFDQPSQLYELAAGNYLLSDKDRKDLYYCPLPSSPQGDIQWIRIPGHGPGQSQSGIILDIGMAVYEHDLMVNVISSEVGNDRYSLDLVLLKFSTGEYHPLARHPRIHVQISSSSNPLVLPRIVGGNLALIVNSRNGLSPNKLLIFDWKTGHKRLQHEGTNGTYTTLVFVSPELLLVPNINLCNFEVWYLPPSNANAHPPFQIHFLQFPDISDSCFIVDIECHGEPSPFLHSMPYLPQRPFFSNPEDSIIIVHFRFDRLPGPSQRAYTLIIHRHALLDMIQKSWTSTSLSKQRNQSSWINDVIVHSITDPDDGLVRLTAQSKWVEITDPVSSTSSPISATCQNSSSFPESYMSAHFGSSFISPGSSTSPSTYRYDIFHVRWENWGPPISRWFEVNPVHAWWSNESSGQRYAFLDRNPDDRTKCIVHVADFNPYNVKKNAEFRAEDEVGKKEEDDEWEMLDHEAVFSEEVYMGLKCVVYHTRDEYDFDAVLMDEERLVGLKLDREKRVERIGILYFG